MASQGEQSLAQQRTLLTDSITPLPHLPEALKTSYVEMVAAVRLRPLRMDQELFREFVVGTNFTLFDEKLLSFNCTYGDQLTEQRPDTIDCLRLSAVLLNTFLTAWTQAFFVKWWRHVLGEFGAEDSIENMAQLPLNELMSYANEDTRPLENFLAKWTRKMTKEVKRAEKH